MRLAIVGSGIAGLSAAHLLSDDPEHSITVLEAAPRLGGRANVTEDGEHCTRLFLHDYEHLFALLREVPSAEGTVRDALRECRRFAPRRDGSWIEIDHIYASLSDRRGLSLRERLALSNENRRSLLVARQAGSRSSNHFAPAWNWTPLALKRAIASFLRPGAALALPGGTDRYLVKPWADFLRTRGVIFRSSAQVERLAVDRGGADVWVNGQRERFDLVLVTAFATEAYALLDRSGVPRPLDHRGHTHCKAFTVDLDPREPILRDPAPRIYAYAGLTTVVQPEVCRCVSLAAFSRTTDTVDILAELTRQLELEHEPLRVRARDNLKPGEAVFIGDYVDPVRLAAPLLRRVYFGGSWTTNSYPVDSAEGACRSAHNAVAAMAADHPRVGLRAAPNLPSAGPDPLRRAAAPLRAHPNAPFNARLARGLWRAAGRLSRLVTLPVAKLDFVDLSGRAWPLDEPGVYVANYRSIFDVPAGVLTFQRLKVFPRLVIARKYFNTAFSMHLKGLGALPALRGTSATVTAATAALEAGDSVAFTVEGRLTPAAEAARAPHGRGAALAALRANAPIIPIASYGSDRVWPEPRPWPLCRIPRQKVVVVIGEPFHPETSSVDELMDDIRTILLHLEDLARTLAGEAEPTPPLVVR